ncbi:hypothetical protein ACJMK2_043038 [Sinanodonta woodiana]|uniref:Band 7 domain-containing protein n=1 Tax=Sinanodonta woodiana TaxID=1069815 RepID=A0ABD3VVP7_SINWO
MYRTFSLRAQRPLRRILIETQQQLRHRSSVKVNTAILFVPQQEAWIIERFGKFNKILEPGFNFIIPVIDSIKYIQSLKEIAIEIPEQHAITRDNVTLLLDGVLYLRVTDPYKASYGIEEPEFAITQLAQTTMRSELGKISLDTVFRERESLNVQIVDAINKASEAWGILCLRYEIRNIKLPQRIQEAMQMQVEAERKKRAAILESEGIREAEINVAEGRKQARILNSEANKQEQINQATGEGEAQVVKARAQASAIDLVSRALAQKNGMNAVSMKIAEQYVAAFGNLAKQGNTVILPANSGDVTNMVTQAMAIYNTISGKGCALVAEKDNDKDSKIDLAHQTLDHTPLTTYSKVHKDDAHHKEGKDDFQQEELKNTYDPRDEKNKELDGKNKEHDGKDKES